MSLIPGALTIDPHVMSRAAGRFIDAFQATWTRLPDGARQAIADYLKAHPGQVHLCFRMDYNDPPVEPFGRFAWYDDHTVFTFLAPFFERADSDEALCLVIVHELGHCYHRASGTWSADNEVEEANVRATTTQWGYPHADCSVSATWKPLVDEWRLHRQVEFGHYTEKRWLGS